MFIIKRDKDSFVLRPEATAGVVRAYLENNLDKTKGFLKVFYTGPMFRAERPQKGRLRQFHHLGAEAIGSDSPYLDAEIISLADRILKELQIQGYKIKINNLGCLKDKIKLVANLKKKLKLKIKSLCPDCKTRYQQNVLRILDCKNEKCKKIIQQLDLNEEHLCPECKEFFQEVKNQLEALRINYLIDPYLVRGLDYYTRTVFEIIHPSLGSQDALGAGGRYDNLVKELGGHDLGAIGFAFGVERLLLTMPKEVAKEKISVYIITLGDAAKKKGFWLLDNLRTHAITCDFNYDIDKSLKGQMRQANKLEAKFVAILGDDELRENAVSLKDMSSGAQEKIGLNNFIAELEGKLK
jgi:histidyl-tRNA synthetase